MKSDHTIQLLPPDQFVWGILDASLLPRNKRIDRKRLGYLFEPLLPMPIEKVQAVYQRIDEHRILACGMVRVHLEDAVDDSTVHLGPDGLPEFVKDELSEKSEKLDETIDPQSLNLLHGAYEPVSVRSMRRRSTFAAVAGVALCAVLLCLGLIRRGDAYRAAAAEIREGTTNLIETTIGRSPAALPPQLHLVAHLRQLEQTRGTELTELQSTDTSRLLAEVLSDWPGHLYTRTTFISVTTNAITIRCQLPQADDVQKLVDALEGPSGWSLEQPQVRRQSEHVDVTLRFQRGADREKGS